MTVTANRVDATDAELEIFRQDVQMLMRDKAKNNILLDDVQFTDDDYYRAIRFATSFYNTLQPPLPTVTWRQINEHVLFHLTAYYLTLSESFLQVRNQVSVPTDNLGVIGIDDKYQLYAALGAGLKAEGERLAREDKMARNIASAYGCMPSGYANVSRFHHH